MNQLHTDLPHAFGAVDFDAEHGLFYVDTVRGHTCRLTLVGRTERGYPRRDLASIPGGLWKHISALVQNELIRGMDSDEQGDNPPKFVQGDNAIGPLIVRELAVLLWALMEDDTGTHLDALVAGWRQLAREERWWLYARASSPAQKMGHGWRRALYYALTDPADTRTAPRLLDIAEAASSSKKNSGAKQTGSTGTRKKKSIAPKTSPPQKSPKKTPKDSKPVKKKSSRKKTGSQTKKTAKVKKATAAKKKTVARKSPKKNTAKKRSDRKKDN